MTDIPNSLDAGICQLGLDGGTDSIEPLRPGSLCPNCGLGKLDYNGLLEFECPICGHRNTGEASTT